MLNFIVDSKRPIINFDGLYKGYQGIVMRHDIDFCPIRANKIAQLEERKGIKSIFFVLVNTNLYDFGEEKNLLSLKNIIALGHEIGLHFDSSKYVGTKSEIDEVCKYECDVLENYLGNNVNIVSFHRPQKKFIGLKNTIGGKIHTYMPDFINQTAYCSDSEGKWRYKDPYNLVKDNSLKRIHLLTHPIWWTTPGNLSSGEKIALHMKGRKKSLKKLAAENCKPYKLYFSLRKKDIE